MKPDPSQFYTGLVSELYEPLAGEKATAGQYTAFIERSGQPVLEPFCGSGSPMLELLELGYDIEGLDASRDMLNRLHEAASLKGLAPTTYCQQIQNMDLPRLYRTIFIAGASMILLPSDELAQQALNKIYQHLEPGGSALIPLELQSESQLQRQVGKFKESRLEDGTLLRCGSTGIDFDEENRQVINYLQYDRISPDGETESLSREWQLRWWSQDLFRTMLKSAGFSRISCVDTEGNRAAADASPCIFLAQKQ